MPTRPIAPAGLAATPKRAAGATDVPRALAAAIEGVENDGKFWGIPNQLSVVSEALRTVPEVAGMFSDHGLEADFRDAQLLAGRDSSGNMFLLRNMMDRAAGGARVVGVVTTPQGLSVPVTGVIAGSVRSWVPGFDPRPLTLKPAQEAYPVTERAALVKAMSKLFNEAQADPRAKAWGP